MGRDSSKKTRNASSIEIERAIIEWTTYYTSIFVRRSILIPLLLASAIGRDMHLGKGASESKPNHCIWDQPKKVYFMYVTRSGRYRFNHSIYYIYICHRSICLLAVFDWGIRPHDRETHLFLEKWCVLAFPSNHRRIRFQSLCFILSSLWVYSLWFLISLSLPTIPPLPSKVGARLANHLALGQELKERAKGKIGDGYLIQLERPACNSKVVPFL